MVECVIKVCGHMMSSDSSIHAQTGRLGGPTTTKEGY